MEQVTARAPKSNKEAVITVDLGANLDDAVTKFGKEVVFSNFKRTVVITIQAGMRRLLEAGKSAEDIQKAYANYRPGVAMERTVDVEALITQKFASMTADEKAAFIKRLKEEASGK